MAMSMMLRDYLDSMGTRYELLTHAPTGCSSETAQAAHVPGRQLAKAVIIEDELEHVAVVIPCTYFVALAELSDRLGRSFCLSREDDLAPLFGDCKTGAVPAVAQAFGVRVLVDDSLLDCDDVYFEAGDHSALVHMAGSEFRQIMARADHGRFGQGA